jgi:hypothetical protein
MPMAVISLSVAELSKTFQQNNGCVGEVSGNLTALENSIDPAVNSTCWILAR